MARRPKKEESGSGYEDPPDGTYFDVMKKDSGFLRISRGEFEGVDRIDIRYFYFDKKKECFLPTRKGVSIPIEKWSVVAKRVNRLLE